MAKRIQELPKYPPHMPGDPIGGVGHLAKLRGLTWGTRVWEEMKVRLKLY